MSTRAPAHAKQEKAIFAFLIAYPSFADEVKKVEQPTASFPDVLVELATGGLVDFELGEWLDGPQTAAAKRVRRRRRGDDRGARVPGREPVAALPGRDALPERGCHEVRGGR